MGETRDLAEIEELKRKIITITETRKKTETVQVVPMRTKVKIPQHNRLDADSFFQQNFKSKLERFFMVYKKFRDAGFFLGRDGNR